MKRVLVSLDLRSHLGSQLLASILQFYQETEDWEIVVKDVTKLNGLDLAALELTGLLISLDHEDQVDEIDELGKPWVNLSGKVFTPMQSTTRVDDRMVGKMAADFLMERSMKGYAFIGKDGRHDSDIRSKAFLDRLDQKGIVPQNCHHLDHQDLEALEKVIPLEGTMGVLAHDDEVALRVVHQLAKLEHSIPSKVTVLGVGNDALVCNSCKPPLTSIELGLEQAGYEAAYWLNDLMEGIELKHQHLLISPQGINERGSTALFDAIDPRLKKAMNHYLEHMDRGHNVEEVSQIAEMSYRSFHRLFKEELGQAPKSWMEQEQHKRAKRLLEDSDLKLMEIARRCGYSDDKALIRAFRRISRQTPAHYRKESQRLKVVRLPDREPNPEETISRP